MSSPIELYYQIGTIEASNAAPATTAPTYPDAGQAWPERTEARLEAMERRLAIALERNEEQQRQMQDRIAALEAQIEQWSAGR